MRLLQRGLSAAALILLTGVIASCDGGSTDNSAWNGGAQLVLQPGLNLAAVPDTIILDPNNPTAPRDPVTNKLIGSSTLSAILLGTDMKGIAGTAVTFTTTAGTLKSAGVPVVTDTAGLAPDTLRVSEDGPSQITVTAATATESKPVVVYVDIAPTANAGPDQTAECPNVALNGSASTDPNSTTGTNDDITLFQWFLGDRLIATGEVTGCKLPVGVHVITLKVTDTMGATDTDTVTVTVVDTTPPVVTLRMSPDRLWPPNHRMQAVQAVLDIHDACDPAPTVQLVSVTSNEPDNGLGDGDTSGDIAGATLGTDDRSVQVRAERAGPGSGRVYTFVYRVTDASGNATQVSATVTVPHDNGH